MSPQNIKEEGFILSFLHDRLIQMNSNYLNINYVKKIIKFSAVMYYGDLHLNFKNFYDRLNLFCLLYIIMVYCRGDLG